LSKVVYIYKNKSKTSINRSLSVVGRQFVKTSAQRQKIAQLFG